LLGCEKLNLSKAKKTDKAQTEQKYSGRKTVRERKKKFYFQKIGEEFVRASAKSFKIRDACFVVPDREMNESGLSASPVAPGGLVQTAASRVLSSTP